MFSIFELLLLLSANVHFGKKVTSIDENHIYRLHKTTKETNTILIIIIGICVTGPQDRGPHKQI